MASVGGSTQGWASCQTLKDGIQYLDQGGTAPDESEEAILKELEELDSKIADLSNVPATPEQKAPEVEEPNTISSADTQPASEEDVALSMQQVRQEGKASDVKTPVAKTPVATPVRSAAPEDLKNLQPPSSLVSGPGQPSSQPLVEAQPLVSACGGESLTENQVPKPGCVTERKLKLRLAAKARIMRMVKAKAKRRDLEVPDWVKEAWGTGNKNEIADLLCSSNFQKEHFFNSLHILVTKKKKVSLTIEEGWFSETELRGEIGWKQAKIDGAKAYCMSLPETHVRKNMYDNETEYWCVIKESGKRKEEQSYEEVHKRQKQATGEPTWDLDKSFSAMQSYEERATQQEKVGGPKPSENNKFTQVKDALARFMESIMAKTGAMRKLIRELKSQYSDPAAAQCIVTLENEIKKVDAQYDLCNEAWARGEADKFATDEFVKEAESKMKAATFVCSKAAAAELKVRNAKKYYDKKAKGSEKPEAKAKVAPDAKRKASAKKPKA